VALLRIDATADVLPGLDDIADLYIIRSNVDHLGADRYRVFGYAPETVIPKLEARGCQVAVLMSTQATEQFHNEIRAALDLPPDAAEPPTES
jgi:hypothetical protein